MKAWKRLEKQTARALDGQRVIRLTAPEPSFATCADVELPDFPGLKIDAKYRARWSHHSFLKGILQKYCEQPWHEPVLVTKERSQRGAFVTIRLEFFARLLRGVRQLPYEKGSIHEESEPTSLSPEKREVAESTQAELECDFRLPAGVTLKNVAAVCTKPVSIGLFKCPRCGAELAEFEPDSIWLRNFKCDDCLSCWHFVGGKLERGKTSRQEQSGTP